MGGCASKPKVDSDTRKVPAPALRKPHAPPEIPVNSPKAAIAEEVVAQDKKDGDENKKTSLIDVSGPVPKTKEPETTEVLEPLIVPVEVNPVEAKVETYELPEDEKKERAEPVIPTEEQKGVVETIIPKEDKKEVTETVVPKEEDKETIKPEAPKEEPIEVAATVVSKEEGKEAVKTEVPNEEKIEVAQVPEEKEQDAAERPTEEKKEIAA